MSPWQPLFPKSKTDLQIWLEKEEARAVNLQSLLEVHPWGRWKELSAVRFWGLGSQPDWRAILAVKGKSLLFPAFKAFPTVSEGEALNEDVLRKLGQEFSLMGPLEWTSALEPWLPPSRPYQRVHYDFMVRNVVSNQVIPESNSSFSWNVLKVGPELANDLFPLQEAYEKEEVLFRPEEFQPLISRWNFAKTLKRELVVAAWADGEPIAKGGTNAVGTFWAQIGGVYTKPTWRRKGAQFSVMVALIHLLNDQGRGACLFVKKENHAARELYKKLGFECTEDFEISYWQRK